MKKYIICFLIVCICYITQAQTISKEEIECIDALILAKTDTKNYFVDIDDYTLARCFEDSLLAKDRNQLIAKLNKLKSDDILRNKFYGMLNYYYENYRFALKNKITIYQIDKDKSIDISNQYPLDTFLNKIYKSTYRELKKEIKFYPNYSVSDSIPKYPGGDKALINFISQHISYPVYEKEADISGKVLLLFIVEKDGSISNIEVLKHVSSGIDCEAIKILKMLPRWIPGFINGKPIRCYLNLPINFTLQ